MNLDFWKLKTWHYSQDMKHLIPVHMQQSHHVHVWWSMKQVPLNQTCNTLDQPCSTSGQLAECSQKGYFVWSNAPLPQKKVETHFCYIITIWKIKRVWQSVLWLQYSVTFENSSYSINHINFIPSNTSTSQAKTFSFFFEGDAAPALS